jgi:hypothetical protein
MTTVLSRVTCALPDRPHARDTHRIWRENDESFLLCQRPQAEDRQGTLASGSVKEHQQRQRAYSWKKA